MNEYIHPSRVPTQRWQNPKKAIPEFVDLRTVAEMFNVTSQTIRNWLKSGKFPGATRVGRKWLIPWSDVQVFLDATYGTPQKEQPSEAPQP